MLLDVTMTEREPDGLQADEDSTPPVPAPQARRGRRRGGRGRRAGPLVTRGGWAFLAAMLAAAALWATLVAIVFVMAHHHLVGPGL
jgi:hypothetical protein